MIQFAFGNEFADFVTRPGERALPSAGSAGWRNEREMMLEGASAAGEAVSLRFCPALHVIGDEQIRLGVTVSASLSPRCDAISGGIDARDPGAQGGKMSERGPFHAEEMKTDIAW